MAKFTKGILKAKRHHSPDGDVDVTPQRLKHWDEQIRLMGSRNWHHSVHYNHSVDPKHLELMQLGPDGKPSRGAHNAVGRLADYKLAADGQSAEITLEIPDAAAAEKARTNVVEVSPIILKSARDGDGNQYDDAIVCWDLVCQPVDNTQTPFVEVPEAIACSLRIFNDAGKPTMYRLATDDNPFAKKDGDGDGEAGEGSANPPAESSQPAEAENPDMPPAKATDKSKLAAVMEGFTQLGLVLPSDFDLTADGAIDLLLTAINTHLAAKRTAEAEEAEAKPDEEEEQMKVSDPGYAAMSLQTRTALAYAERQHREGVKARLAAILKTGRCTPAEHEAHATALTAVKLSLNESGDHIPGDLEKWLDSREAVPAGTFWTDEQKTTRMSMNVVEPPASMRSGLTTDEVQATVDFALGRKTAAAK